MKLFIYIYFVFLIFTLPKAFSQQLSQSSLNQINKYNINKAYAGLDSCIEGYIQQKNHWQGIKGAPINRQLQAHTQFNQVYGAGLSIKNFSVSILNSFEVAGTFVRHFQLKNNIKLSAAAHLGFYQFSVNTGNLTSFEYDRLLDQNRNSKGGFFGDIAVLATHRNWETGISVPRVLNTNIKFQIEKQPNLFIIERHIQIHALYKKYLNPDFLFIPMVMYRSIPQAGGILDVLAGVNYKKLVTVNLGYRTNSGLLFAADFTWNNLIKLGYAYDVGGMQNLSGISAGSHEFLVGMKMCKPAPEPPKVFDQFMMGKITDPKTNEGIKNADLEIENLQTGEKTKIKTDEFGNYQFKTLQNTTYNIKVSHPDYHEASTQMNTGKENKNSLKNIELTAKSAILAGLVINSKTKTPEPGVRVTFTQDKEKFSGTTDSKGKFNINLNGKKLNDKLNYEVRLEKPEFVTGKTNFQGKIIGYESIGPEKPFEIVPEKLSPEKLAAISTIYYDFNSSKIKPEYLNRFKELAQVLNEPENEKLKVQLQGHADCRGKDKFNLNLSTKRAKNAAEVLKKMVKNKKRISFIGIGEKQPEVNCECEKCSDSDLSKNRRTEVKIK